MRRFYGALLLSVIFIPVTFFCYQIGHDAYLESGLPTGIFAGVATFLAIINLPIPMVMPVLYYGMILTVLGLDKEDKQC